MELNNLSSQIACFCVALHDKTALNDFYVRESSTGYSGNSFAQPVDQEGESYRPICAHRLLGFTVDDFIKSFAREVPNYIKIDVDGNELRILRGAGKTLSSGELRSLLVEADMSRRGEFEKMEDLLKEFGFKVERKEKAIDREDCSAFNFVFTKR